MRFLLVTPGSAGDVYPFLSLGSALQQASHHVTLLADARYAAAAQAGSMRFVSISAAGNEPVLPPGESSRLQRLEALYSGLAPNFGGLLDQVIALLPEHDVLVVSHLFPFLKNAAQAARRKSVSLVFSPDWVPFTELRPDDAPAPSRWATKFLPRAQNRSAWNAAEKSFDEVVARYAGAALREKGLGEFQGFLRYSADQALVTVSPALFPPPGSLPEKYAYTGFLPWRATADEKATADLARVAAIEHMAVPLPVLTFGSMPPPDARETFRRLLSAWPLGAPLVVQSGITDWAEVYQRPDVLVVSSLVPQERLFAHATVIIHHGGAGTTAAALAAGRPQIIIPHWGSQFDWARHCAALGVAKTLSRENWPENLAGTVATVLSERPRVLRAVECASRTRAEDGAAATVRALEKL